MHAWSSMVTKSHDHFTPSGRRERKPERTARKAASKAASKAKARRIKDGVRQSEQTRFYD